MDEQVEKVVLRLKEIQEEIDHLVSEAERLLRRTTREMEREIIYQRAYAYWIPHIKGALYKKTEFLGGSMHTMEETIEEMEGEE